MDFQADIDPTELPSINVVCMHIEVLVSGNKSWLKVLNLYSKWTFHVKNLLLRMQSDVGQPGLVLAMSLNDHRRL